MTNEELIKFNKNRKIQQIAIVTPDLEKTMKAWVEHLGIGPWIVVSVSDKSLDYLHFKGELVDEPFEFRIALANVGEMQFELIQPVSGPTIYAEFLNKNREGLHHIKEKITTEIELGKAVDNYKKKGFNITQDGKFGKDLHYYLDTENKLGFAYEIGNSPDLDIPADMYSIFPAEKE